MERRLREEQDRRFAESARRDQEKVAERLREETRRREKEEEEERVRGEAALRDSAIEEARRLWRAGARAKWLTPGRTGGVRVRIRFPDGKGATGAFAKDDPVLALFCLVDAQLHPANDAPVEADDVDLAHALEAYALTPEEWFGFRLFLSYPRREIAFGVDGKGTLGSAGVEGSVSVELVSRSRPASVSEKAGEGSDGYETEEE